MNKKELFELQMDNMYTFVKCVFNDGCVPESRDEFRKSLSRETTDGSLCMAYDFGDRERDETAMIFFYPHTCSVPQKYQQHLKDKYNQPYGMLFLENDYIYMSTASSSDIKFLKQTIEFVQERYEMSKITLASEIGVNRDLYPAEEANRRNTELVKHTMVYELDLIKLIDVIQKRIDALSSSSSGGGMQEEVER